MRGKYFIDTNIFVYSFDPTSKKKQKKAQDIIASALSKNQGIISYQVIQEFINVATRKFKTPLTPQEAFTYMDRILFPLCEIFPDSDLFKKAISLQNEINFSFYDCLVISSALKGRCKIIYTEDLQHGQTISGLTILDPFHEH